MAMEGRTTAWRRRLRIGLVLAIVTAVFATATPFSVPSLAQENLPGVRKTPGLLDLFFRRKSRDEAAPRREAPREAPRDRTRTRQEKRARTGTASAPAVAPAAETAVQKREDAKTVLVVGDFFAAGLAEGLATAFAENDAVRIVSRTSGSSGFVRSDYYDWPGEIGAILAEEKPAAVVVMLGANDRQEMSVNGSREPLRSAAWTTTYEARATALASAFRAANVPFVWVGAPPFRFSAMSADMLAFNDVYRDVAEEAGGSFVDIWAGFSDENGVFSATGPDINGQPAKLRGNDGINLTKPGKRKLAFFVEKPLARILNLDGAQPAGVADPLPGPPTPGAPAVPAAPVDRTVPISLADPEPDGSAELLGATGPRRPGGKGLAEQMSSENDRFTPRRGRADEFRPLTRDEPPSGGTSNSTGSIEP